MPDNDNQNQPKISSDSGSISMDFNNSGGRIEKSTINITNIINASVEDAKSPFRNKVIDIEYFEPETILIPEGPFWMGSDPGQEVNQPVYRISKYPIKNVAYQQFVSQERIEVNPAMGWIGQAFPEGLGNHPVTGVTFHEALAYCQWLSKKTGGKRIYSLPNEAQWEKAYRSGSFDTVENVQQWTCTLWGKKLFPPDPQYAAPWKDDARNNLTASNEIRRVLRGSKKNQDVASHDCTFRRCAAPGERGPEGARFGFRVVMLV